MNQKMDKDILQRYISGEATVEEKRLVTEWVRKDEKNMQELIALRKLHNIAIWHVQEKKEVLPRNAYAGKRVLWRICEVAAIIAIVLSATLLWTQKEHEHTDVMQTLYVPPGQRAELFLADGTKVWLNAHSSLTFPTNFTADTRTVKLDGEGYFQVAGNEKKPFIVETGKFNVKVLGTEFNMIAYSSSSYFETSLIKGAVEVFSPEKPGNVQLEPHTRVSLIDGKLRKTSFSDEQYFLWREGIIYFEGESVKNMLDKLQLYYDVKIVVNNRQILSNRYTGKFRTKDGIEHALRVLQLNNKFTYQKDEENNTIYVN